MGHIDVSGVDYSLSDGRVLLNNVSFRVGDGAKVALIGPNGSGKTTLIRMICGDIFPDDGRVSITGGLGVMRQFIGSVRDESTVHDLLISIAPKRIRDVAAKVVATELAMSASDSEKDQMAYAQAIIDWGDAGGYDFEVMWDVCCTEMLNKTFENLSLENLTEPFDFEVFFGDRIAVLGKNGTGKSHFLRMIAGDESVKYSGTFKIGARVEIGYFAQTHAHPEYESKTLLEILWETYSLQLGAAKSVLKKYEIDKQAEQKFSSLSGGQQARFQVLILELSGSTLLLLDEPTDNLDLASAESLASALDRYEGTVLSVTHDRWFTRGFTRFLVFGAGGQVYESPTPIFDH